MINAINRVQLIGYIGADPDYAIMENGSKRCTANICTNFKYKDKSGNKITETTWHKIVSWGVIADFMSKYVKKGSHVVIDGRIQNSKYQTKDGSNAISTQIHVNEIMLLGRGSNNNNAPDNGDSNSQEGEEDDLPF